MSGRVLSSAKYRVISNKRALDRIEQAIRCAEFSRNRAFVFSRLNSPDPDLGAILPDYTEDIDYWFGTIPALFKQHKEEASKAMLRVQDLHELLRRFVESADPVEACVIAEQLYHEFGGSLAVPEIFDRELYDWSVHHKERINSLRNDGALDYFIAMRGQIMRDATRFLESLDASDVEDGTLHYLEVTYEPGDLCLVGVANDIWSNGDDELRGEFCRIVEASEGKVAMLWRFGLQRAGNNRAVMNEVCVREIMDKIYALKYFEDEEIWGPSK